MVHVLLFAQYLVIKTSQGKSLWVSKILLNKKRPKYGRYFDALLFDFYSDGSHAVKVFYCKISGCVANVTDVFCKDEPVPVHRPLPNCTGTPLNNTVCQHDGRVFISYDGNGDCEFEGKLIGYIDTAKCPGIFKLFKILQQNFAWILIRCDPTFIVCNVLSYP